MKLVASCLVCGGIDFTKKESDGEVGFECTGCKEFLLSDELQLESLEFDCPEDTGCSECGCRAVCDNANPYYT